MGNNTQNNQNSTGQTPDLSAIFAKYGYTPPAQSSGASGGTGTGWYAAVQQKMAAKAPAAPAADMVDIGNGQMAPLAPLPAVQENVGQLDADQLKQAAQKIIDSVSTAGTKLGRDANGTPMGEIKGVGDVLEGLLGGGAGIVQGVTSPITAVLQKALMMDPAAAKPGAPDAALGEQSTQEKAYMAAAQKFATDHPELVQNLKDSVTVGGALMGGESGLFPGGDMTLTEAGQAGKTLATNAVQKIRQAAEIGATGAGATAGAAGKVAGAAGRLAKTGIGALAQLTPDDMSFIKNNPDLFTKEAMGNASRQSLAEEVAAAAKNKVETLQASKIEQGVHPQDLAEQAQAGINKRVSMLNASKEAEGVSARALGDEIKGALDKREAKLSADAHDYGQVTGARTPGSKDGPSIKVSPTFLERKIKELTGRAVVKGKIDMAPNTAAAIRDPRELKNLQSFLDQHNPAFKSGQLSGNEFLNVRDDLTNLSNFDTGSSKPSDTLERVGKGLRASLNDTYRNKFEGLEQADNQYAADKNALDKLRVGLLGNDGELSDSAMQRLLGSSNESGFSVRDKLEELSPGVTKRAQRLQAINDEIARTRAGIADERGNLREGAASKINNIDKENNGVLSARLEKVVPGIGDRVSKLHAINDEIARTRAGILDENGNLLEGAANKITNATGIGKDELGRRLKELVPDIEHKIQHVKTVENIDEAGNLRKPGTYVRAAAASSALAMSPAAAIAIGLTHPYVFVPLLRRIGYTTAAAQDLARQLGIVAKVTPK